MQRWRQAGCFEMLVEDVRSLRREWGGQQGPADGGLHRRPDVAVDAGVGRARQLRRGHVALRIEGSNVPFQCSHHG